MLQQIKHWWNRDKISAELLKQQLQAAEQEISSSCAHVMQLETKLTETETKLADAEAKLTEIATHDEQIHESTTPYFVLRCEGADELRGLQIEMDWNLALVQYLKENGHVGRSEEVVIQKWLAMLYEDLVERLEQQLIDNSDRTPPNDFV